MKTFGLCAGIGFLAFVLMGYQTGIFQITPIARDNPATEEKTVEKKPARARFPQDLTPATRAEPVPRAAAYDPGAKTQRLTILKTTGALYQDWQERLNEDWQADSVENTALVIVVGPQKKIFLEKILYPNGAPPINRYKFELEASIIEARTGKVLAYRQFINVARDIVRIETWDTTALGSPVDFRTVFQWAAAGAKKGFPPENNPAPIINIVN